MVINFINPSWAPCHITIKLFEALDTFGVALRKQVKVLVAEFNLTNKVIAYVKYDGVNLNSFPIALISIVSCEPL